MFNFLNDHRFRRVFEILSPISTAICLALMIGFTNQAEEKNPLALVVIFPLILIYLSEFFSAMSANPGFEGRMPEDAAPIFFKLLGWLCFLGIFIWKIM